MSALGRHILVEFYGCTAKDFNDVAFIEQSMINAAQAAQATIINSTFHHFSPFGVSGVVVIQESHLAIHTWPEYAYAAVDIFTCGEEVNPWIAYQFLLKQFEADNGSAMELKRGQLDVIGAPQFEVDYNGQPVNDLPKLKQNRNVWFTERNDDIAFSLQHKGDRLFRQQTEMQLVEIYDTLAYGKMMTIDQKIMCTEHDEYGYHEMISHIPMFAATGQIKRALVIGGGDGGTVRELLKHDGLEEVVMVEIDAAVVEASRLHLPTLSSALDHPKLKLLIADGIDYVKNAADASFDLIIIDSTDPIGPAEGLFSYDFYQNAYRILSTNGLLVTQSESPRFNVDSFKASFTCFYSIFGKEKVNCYLAFIPTYPTGMWSFSFCSKGDIHPFNTLDVAKANTFVQAHDLQYYNSRVHLAAFALPNFVERMLGDL